MRPYALLNITAFLAVLVVNYLANALPLNGYTPGELSDRYPNLFVPAGLTFAIWGVIYTWLLVWIIAQAIALFSENMRNKVGPGVEKAGYGFALTCVLNIAWLFAWHWHQIPLSVGIMVALLATLWQLNRRVGSGFTKSNSTEKWLLHAPLGVYQGWISIALIANVTALLVSTGWQGGGIAEFRWAIILIVAGVLIADMVMRRTNQVFHGLAVAWALFGIYLKRQAASGVDDMQVGYAALLGLAVVLIWVGVRAKRWWAY